MKAWWTKLAARIDALTLRERVFLFLSLIAASFALADVVWLSPAQMAHKQLTQRFHKQGIELQRARDELKAIGSPANGAQVQRAEIMTVKARIASMNQNITDVLPAAADSTPLAQALAHFLRRHEGLTLVRTATLPAETALAKAGKAGDASALALPVGMTRQGVELTVTGPYPELMRYVQTLENSLPHVRWGVMELKSEKLPPELTLQLFLIGVQP